MSAVGLPILFLLRLARPSAAEIEEMLELGGGIVDPDPGPDPPRVGRTVDLRMNPQPLEKGLRVARERLRVGPGPGFVRAEQLQGPRERALSFEASRDRERLEGAPALVDLRLARLVREDPQGAGELPVRVHDGPAQRSVRGCPRVELREPGLVSLRCAPRALFRETVDRDLGRLHVRDEEDVAAAKEEGEAALGLEEEGVDPRAAVLLRADLLASRQGVAQDDVQDHETLAEPGHAERHGVEVVVRLRARADRPRRGDGKEALDLTVPARVLDVLEPGREGGLPARLLRPLHQPLEDLSRCGVLLADRELDEARGVAAHQGLGLKERSGTVQPEDEAHAGPDPRHEEDDQRHTAADQRVLQASIHGPGGLRRSASAFGRAKGQGVPPALTLTLVISPSVAVRYSVALP